jgi:hypothetical protein
MTAFSIPIFVIYINAIFAFLLVEILHYIQAKKVKLRCEFFIKHVYYVWAVELVYSNLLGHFMEKNQALYMRLALLLYAVMMHCMHKVRDNNSGEM